MIQILVVDNVLREEMGRVDIEFYVTCEVARASTGEFWFDNSRVVGLQKSTLFIAFLNSLARADIVSYLKQ